MSSSSLNGIWMRLLLGSLFIAMNVNLYLIFLFAPEERSMGHISRILYFHVPSDWIMFLAFLVVFIGSILYLWKRDHKYDIVAHSAAEIGVMFASLAVITGSIWARPVWNVWWVWSPRLTTFLVLWFIYIAYLMLRNFVEGEERSARFASVFGIVGFVDVPIVYLSTRLWRDIHPGPVIGGGEDSGMHPDMRITFFFSLFTFTLLFMVLLIQRIKLQKSIISLAQIKGQMDFQESEPAETNQERINLK